MVEVSERRAGEAAGHGERVVAAAAMDDDVFDLACASTRMSLPENQDFGRAGIIRIDARDRSPRGIFDEEILVRARAGDVEQILAAAFGAAIDNVAAVADAVIGGVVVIPAEKRCRRRRRSGTRRCPCRRRR